MTKVSPIAEFLTANKAVSRRNDNIWHFYTKEGLYLGRQVKIEQNGTTTYIREIFGEGLKRLFYECKTIAEQCIYCSDKKFPLGIGILPSRTFLITQFINQLTNTIQTIQTERQLISPLSLVAVDENVNVGIYQVEKPYKYSEKCISDEKFALKKQLQIKHTIH